MSKRTFSRLNTAEDVTRDIDLSGKTALVTGINSGLGEETMRVLEARGAHVIGTARTLEKAEAACSANGGNVTPVACELTDLDSVADCAEQVIAMGRPIDMLICNAGIMALPELETKYGLEMQFLTNHMGHFLLIHKLLDTVKAADEGRVVILSSAAHMFAPKAGIDFDNLDGSKSYGGMPFYGQSKLANLLTAIALTEKLEGTGVTANALHPGVIDTNLGRNFTGIQASISKSRPFNWLLMKVFRGKTIPQGASTTCWAATAPELEGVSGKYMQDNRLARSSRHGRDRELAGQLWDYSCDFLAEYL